MEISDNMLKNNKPPRDWVFDLDNTLYSETCNLFGQVEIRIQSFVGKFLNLEPETASKLQKKYFRDYGTTLRGLMECNDVDPIVYLDYVHDIDLDVLPPNPDLNAALHALPGRTIIFTNADLGHAERVMERLGVGHHFEAVFDIVACDYVPKPEPAVYQALVQKFDLEPTRTVMVEDMARNLKPAADMGMTTVWVRSDNDWGREGSDDGYVDHIADDLTKWLSSDQSVLTS
jgi:putative hydrolase of the HAD superfamily